MTAWTENGFPIGFFLPRRQGFFAPEVSRTYRERQTEQGKEFQIYTSTLIDLPCGHTISNYFEEITEATKHLVDVTLDFVEEDDHRSASIIAEGWRPAAPEEAEALLKIKR